MDIEQLENSPLRQFIDIRKGSTGVYLAIH
jgi:hypothetical protein